MSDLPYSNHSWKVIPAHSSLKIVDKNLKQAPFTSLSIRTSSLWTRVMIWCLSLFFAKTRVPLKGSFQNLGFNKLYLYLTHGVHRNVANIPRQAMESLREFLENSTIHGLCHISTSRSRRPYWQYIQYPISNIQYMYSIYAICPIFAIYPTYVIYPI